MNGHLGEVASQSIENFSMPATSLVGKEKEWQSNHVGKTKPSKVKGGSLKQDTPIWKHAVDSWHFRFELRIEHTWCWGQKYTQPLLLTTNKGLPTPQNNRPSCRVACTALEVPEVRLGAGDLARTWAG